MHLTFYQINPVGGISKAHKEVSLFATSPCVISVRKRVFLQTDNGLNTNCVPGNLQWLS
jgi:hypothetical protein